MEQIKPIKPIKQKAIFLPPKIDGRLTLNRKIPILWLKQKKIHIGNQTLKEAWPGGQALISVGRT
jgi:hypothetical protein